MADDIFWNFKLYIQIGIMGCLILKFLAYPVELFLIPSAVLVTTMLALILLWQTQKELIRSST